MTLRIPLIFVFKFVEYSSIFMGISFTFVSNLQIDRRSFGELQTFDLVPGGARIAVTKSNRL